MNGVTSKPRRIVVGVVASLLWILPACGGDEEPSQGELRGGGTEALTARTLGTAYLEDGHLEAAEEQFQRLVELVPESPIGYANLGRVALQRGDPDQTRSWARKALDRSSGEQAYEIQLLVAAAHLADEDTASARSLLRELVEEDDGRVEALWQLARLSPDEALDLLERLVDEGPANVAARTELATAYLRADRPEDGAAQLEELRQVAPELPPDAEPAYRSALDAARGERLQEARAALRSFRDRYELTPEYQAALNRLRGPRGVRPGRIDLSFADGGAGLGGGGPAGLGFRLRSVSEAVGLEEVPPGLLASGDVDGDETPDLLAGGGLYRNAGGRFVPLGEPGLPDVGGDLRAAAFGDLDNDGRLELILAGPDGVRIHPLRERASKDGETEAPDQRDASLILPVPDGVVPGVVRILDLDQDGDLDLFVAAGGGNLAYRNDGDGSFTELAEEMGLDGPGAGVTPDAASLDVGGDGYLDLVVTAPDGALVLYRNQGHGRFEDRELVAGGPGEGGGVAVAAGDVDHDGAADLILARDGELPMLLASEGEGEFAGPRPVGGRSESRGGTSGLTAGDLRLVDLDNDGRLDLVHVGHRSGTGGRGAGSGGGLTVYQGREGGDFSATPEVLPEALPERLDRVTAEDFDGDGDLDLVLAGPSGVVYLRNDGGNANNFLRLRLVGLRDGSGKNNHFGIGARVEVRAGDLYQMRTVEEAVTHIGLADRRRADVVRIVWPNGVPQVLYEASAETAAAEDQELKGSCAFLYAWNGERFEMVTDVMWRSAIGMPLGIMGGPSAGRGPVAPASPTRYASAEASLEYVRIPPGALEARDGRYHLRLTEELWEVAYVDELRLVAVDHPDSADVFVNEAFRPPGPPNRELHTATSRRPPVEARNGEGRDVLPELKENDDVHVADLTPTRYQGVTEMHEIVLRAGGVNPEDRVRLFLRGWVFPTDASINVAISQNPELQVVPPYLEVPDGEGGWTTVLPELSFPSGKEKTVVADLTGRLPPEDPRVRIRTNMQVYWDQAFFAVDRPGVELRRTALHPSRATLHERGFSREYRKGGRHGPHWFDYDSVRPGPRWGRAITGRYTRPGDVRELLAAAESHSVVMAPGDEIRLAFDAESLPSLPAGWSRTFLLYSNGWIKDADLNTLTGQGVDPMPYHGMAGYPPPSGAAFPRDAADRAYLEEYQTRVLEPRPSPLLDDGG